MRCEAHTADNSHQPAQLVQHNALHAQHADVAVVRLCLAQVPDLVVTNPPWGLRIAGGPATHKQVLLIAAPPVLSCTDLRFHPPVLSPQCHACIAMACYHPSSSLPPRPIPPTHARGVRVGGKVGMADMQAEAATNHHQSDTSASYLTGM